MLDGVSAPVRWETDGDNDTTPSYGSASENQ